MLRLDAYRKPKPGSPEQGRVLAQAIVDTVREPLLVLDQDQCVVSANQSFYATFQANREETLGRPLSSLCEGQWSSPELATLLADVAARRSKLEHFEVECDFPRLGRRIVLLLNARKVVLEGNNHTTILLAMEDVTERRAAERELQQLLRQKELLLGEMQHRMANSLQIIASILQLKARTVQSEETKRHLEDAHSRVITVAAMQQHLQATGKGEAIAVAPYLSKLCDTLAQSLLSGGRPISLAVVADEGNLSSSDAVSVGLIVTEGVLNALKHAFPRETPGRRIVVTYAVDKRDWTLSISDNGVGKHIESTADARVGLGTSIVEALAQQLGARVVVVTGESGTTLKIVHAAS